MDTIKPTFASKIDIEEMPISNPVKVQKGKTKHIDVPIRIAANPIIQILQSDIIFLESASSVRMQQSEGN